MERSLLNGFSKGRIVNGISGRKLRGFTLVDLLVAVSIMSVALIVFLAAALTARGVIDKSQYVSLASQSASSQAAATLGNVSSLAAGTTSASVTGIPQGQITTTVSTYGGSAYLKRADFSVTWGAASSQTLYSAGTYNFSTLVSYPNHISGLYSTGVDDTGALLSQGATDTHYTIITGPQTGALYVPPPNPVWYARTSTSQWISPSVVQSASLPAGTYQYRTTFTVTGPATGLTISVNCSSDDTITDVRLNGTSVATNVGAYNTWTNFTITSAFVSGTNTLDFYLSNVGSSSSGLQLQMTGTP